MTRDSPDRSAAPENVLLETGDHGDCEESACMDRLGVAEPSEVNVLFVTFTKSARERIDALKRHADAPPANVGVVSVQIGAAGASSGDRIGGEGGPTVRRISDPSDLTGVGIAISEFLSAWSGDDNRTVVCFESLTALLQYVDANRVFQFCNEITSKFEQAGAHAHFHITPGAHERQVLSVLSSLFDGRVSAADLGYGPDVDGPADADTPVHPPADTADAADAGDDPTSPDADHEPAEDPFEYAAGDVEPDTDDVGEHDPSTTLRDERGETGADEPAEPGADDRSEEPPPADEPGGETTDGRSDPPAGDPADLVSSVIAGDADPDPAGAPDGDSDGSTDGDASGADEPRAETTDDEAGPAATRRAEREEMRSRLQYIGPDASTPESSGSDDDDGDSAGEAADVSDTSGLDKYTFYQRTTATVVGVVVMLLLMSFFAAAMPLPLGTDAPGDGADVTATPTPDEVAAADATDEGSATATEDGSTPDPTATATPTPTATRDQSTGSSSASSGSSSGDGSTAESTATETPTPESTPTATPTETDDGDDSLVDGVSDTLDGDDDSLL